MERDYDMIESMAKTYKLSSAEQAIIREALRGLETAYRKGAHKDKSDAQRLHKLADKSRSLLARFDGTIIGSGYAFTEL